MFNLFVSASYMPLSAVGNFQQMQCLFWRSYEIGASEKYYLNNNIFLT